MSDLIVRGGRKLDRGTEFLSIDRQKGGKRPASDRIGDSEPVELRLSEAELREQAARCMNCGIPYCHNGSNEIEVPATERSGCPVENQIPDWNDLVFHHQWQAAATNLHTTNNFPEFTGQVCPAPCEASCTLNMIDQPVTIKAIESAIIERAFAEGWVLPEVPAENSGRRVAIVGSGPAGLACAQQLRRMGHEVVVFEKQAKPGGLLRYGVPDFKLSKDMVDRRLEQLSAEGVKFRCGTEIGRDISSDYMVDHFDAVALAIGSETPRELNIPGRELGGVYPAMEFLVQQNRFLSGEIPANTILAAGKNVVVIGGGDTGSDCIGTSYRMGAVSVTQMTHGPQPPDELDKDQMLKTWPHWPHIVHISSSHEEGSTAMKFGAGIVGITGENGVVTGLSCVELDANRRPIRGSAFTVEADLVLLAIGFEGPARAGPISELGLKLTTRGNVSAPVHKGLRVNGVVRSHPEGDYLTSHTNGKVFAGGDVRRGASLVVNAIHEGRGMAEAIHKKIMAQAALIPA